MVLNRLFVLSLILVTAVTVAEFCEEDQFETGWLGGCADCPEDPEKHCDNEGENADNCRSRCITEKVTSNIKPRIKPNAGTNITIPIGTALGVVALIIFVFLVVYIYRGNSNGGHAVENVDDIEMQPVVVNRNTDAEDDQPQVAATAAEVRLVFPEASFDLDTRKETEQLGY